MREHKTIISNKSCDWQIILSFIGRLEVSYRWYNPFLSSNKIQLKLFNKRLLDNIILFWWIEKREFQ